MLQSKYLTQDGLEFFLKGLHRDGFRYLFYDPTINIYITSEQKPCFEDTKYMHCYGDKKTAIVSQLETAIVAELLEQHLYIAIEDHIDVVDWSKVPVDTPILVKSDDNCWYHRHFAKYEDGRIYTWRDGMTSWSLKSCDDDNIAYIHWEYAKLADDTNR